MQCLAQPISNNTWKRIRNQYCQLLLYQLVEKGRLSEPFDSEPCPGPLQNLPANALTQWQSSQRSSSRWRTQGGCAYAQFVVILFGALHADARQSSHPAAHAVRQQEGHSTPATIIRHHLQAIRPAVGRMGLCHARA